MVGSSKGITVYAARMGETKTMAVQLEKRISGPTLPVEGPRPLAGCRVTVEYVMDDPHLQTISVSSGCGDDAALALAIAITALLQKAAETAK